MLPTVHFGPYAVLKKNLKDIKEIKDIVNSSVTFDDHTKGIVNHSTVNCTEFYAIPNIHKPTLAFFPAVSNIGTIHFLSQTLSPFTPNSKNK